MALLTHLALSGTVMGFIFSSHRTQMVVAPIPYHVLTIAVKHSNHGDQVLEMGSAQKNN